MEFSRSRNNESYVLWQGILVGLRAKHHKMKCFSSSSSSSWDRGQLWLCRFPAVGLPRSGYLLTISFVATVIFSTVGAFVAPIREPCILPICSFLMFINFKDDMPIVSSWSFPVHHWFIAVFAFWIQCSVVYFLKRSVYMHSPALQTDEVYVHNPTGLWYPDNTTD